MPFLNAYSDITSEPLIEGMIYDTTPWTGRTGFNEDTVILPFGYGLAKAATDLGVKLPSAATDIFQGIAVYSPINEKRDGYSIDAEGRMGYPLKYELAILKEGVIAVRIDGNVTAGQPAFCRHTATGGQRRGQFRADADTATALAVPNSKFILSGVAGSIVPLFIKLV